jgi:uncharacterized membrane protein YqjE
MAGRPAPFRNPAGYAGLLDNLLSLVSTLTEFFEARVGLIAKESRSALVHLAVLAGCLVGAVVLLLLGYLFLVAGAVVGLAHLLKISWIWTALGAGLLHFILGLVLVIIARGQMTRPVFRESASELKKDREWLKNLNKTSRTTN